MKTQTVSAFFVACLLSGAIAAPTKPSKPGATPSSQQSSSTTGQQGNPSAQVPPVNQQAGGIFDDPKPKPQIKPGDEQPKLSPNDPKLPQGDESVKVPKEDPKNNPSLTAQQPNVDNIATYRPPEQNPDGQPGVAPHTINDDPKTHQPPKDGKPVPDQVGTNQQINPNPAEAAAPSNYDVKSTFGGASENKLSGTGSQAVDTTGSAIGFSKPDGMAATGAGGLALKTVENHEIKNAGNTGLNQLEQAKEDGTRGGEKTQTGTQVKDPMQPASMQQGEQGGFALPSEQEKKDAREQVAKETKLDTSGGAVGDDDAASVGQPRTPGGSPPDSPE
ncbi:hypothetical protein BDZ85DRAFT_285359 [Elsinoe ampelina]|uniref:Uncharacterized protein n=1 Tax=Elsinoe ampelina TaxID=302913 RepID=A0A6A6G1A4_9PEZI|nr:hypothetical protein BDZ85DRAFT_285359 [Elsinoe ampelina]